MIGEQVLEAGVERKTAAGSGMNLGALAKLLSRDRLLALVRLLALARLLSGRRLWRGALGEGWSGEEKRDE